MREKLLQQKYEISRRTEKIVDEYFIPKGKTDYCSIDATAHYIYNQAQSVDVPHSEQQVNKIYYLSPCKVHLLGIQDEAVCEQINYVLDEGEIIGKGPNTNSTFNGIKRLNKDGKCLKITCNNAGGQNKNNATIRFQ